jgi:hypothetical protein
MLHKHVLGAWIAQRPGAQQVQILGREVEIPPPFEEQFAAETFHGSGRISLQRLPDPLDQQSAVGEIV